jgi:hypothetical protein
MHLQFYCTWSFIGKIEETFHAWHHFLLFSCIGVWWFQVNTEVLNNIVHHVTLSVFSLWLQTDFHLSSVVRKISHPHICNAIYGHFLFSPSPLLASSFLFPLPYVSSVMLFVSSWHLPFRSQLARFFGIWIVCVFFTDLKLCLALVSFSAWLTLPGYICFDSAFLWSFWPVSRGYSFLFPPVLPVLWS